MIKINTEVCGLTFYLLLQGEDVIAVLPWDEWWEFELNKDNSNPHIALLPLHPDMRARFNETAAWEYALSMAGKPYGFHNLIFSWIDTMRDNYPPPLDAHVVQKIFKFTFLQVLVLSVLFLVSFYHLLIVIISSNTV